MKWGAAVGITIIMVLIVLFEWPKLKQAGKKDKAAFISVSMIGWALGIMLVFIPDPPGPTELVDALFKPLGKLME